MEELAFPDHPSLSIHIHPVPITRIWFSFENNVTHVLQSWGGNMQILMKVGDVDDSLQLDTREDTVRDAEALSWNASPQEHQMGRMSVEL